MARAMSAAIAAMVLDQGDVSTEEKFVLVLLGDNANHEGGLYIPSADKIGLGCSLPAEAVEGIFDRFKLCGILACDGPALHPAFVTINLEALRCLPENRPRPRRRP